MDLTLQAEEVVVGGDFPVGEVGVVVMVDTVAAIMLVVMEEVGKGGWRTGKTYDGRIGD